MVHLIDNYDSFTFNIAHYLQALDVEFEVIKNDDPDLLAKRHQMKAVIISPGPGLPNTSGFLMEWLSTISTETKLLGVCLGMQAIAEHFGGKLMNLPQVRHGVSTRVELNDSILFKNIMSPTEVGLYHSWAIDPNHLPKCLKSIATDKEGVIMGIEHEENPIFAVQFHPESIMSLQGKQLLKNWIEIK